MKKESQEIAQNAIELVRMRNNFYRDNYRRVTVILFFSVILNFFFVGGIIYLYKNMPKPVYFATNENGSLLQMIPLDQPYITDEQLKHWAVEAATAAYSFNFLDYQNNLQQARKYFTEAGFNNYYQALKSSGNLSTVLDKRLVVKATVSDVPLVTFKGMLNGRYVWKVQVPMIVRYVTAGSEFKQPIVVDMLVGRVSTLDAASGVAIAQFVVSDRKQPK